MNKIKLVEGTHYRRRFNQPQHPPHKCFWTDAPACTLGVVDTDSAPGIQNIRPLDIFFSKNALESLSFPFLLYL